MKEIPIVSVKQMRECDAAMIKKLGDSKILMYQAGQAVVEEMEHAGILDLALRRQTSFLSDERGKEHTQGKGRVAIICGTGNNAGDGYVIAQLLWKRGMFVELFLMEERFSEDGGYYFHQCRELGIPYKVLDMDFIDSTFLDVSILIDCIYGTGFHGKLSPFAHLVIKSINQSLGYKVSVDINSGMNGDIGVEECCVHSDLTVSIGFFKTAHFLEDSEKYMKKLVNVNIGIELVEVL